MTDKDYIVIVQCHIVKERCSGYFCEKAFNERADGFAAYPKDKAYRTLYMTCGGCCGKSVQRRVTHLARNIEKKEGIGRDRLVVHLASCITRSNFHWPRCVFADAMKEAIQRAGVEVREDTHVSSLAENRRAAGQYGCGAAGRTGASD